MIHISDLRKTYGAGFGAVDGIKLNVRKGMFFSIVGPSGCGKTTTLRCIAGLERPDSGEIEIDGETVFSSTSQRNVPPHRRSVGMVFQSYAIWPHMTVWQNVAYPLKNLRRSRDEIGEQVVWALRLVGLEGKADRPAPLLSGGEQQRVAFARALVERPQVLLLDEPLSNLDAKLREDMRFELRQLQQTVGSTALYVTHDQDEAFVLSDEMAVMHKGRIVEVGRPTDLYRTPRTEFGAEFLGLATKVEGEVLASDDKLATVETPLGCLECPVAERLSGSERVFVYIRPEDVELAAERPDSGGFVVNGSIEQVVVMGGIVEWWAVVNGVRLRARSLNNSTQPLVPRAGVSESVPIRIRLSTSPVRK